MANKQILNELSLFAGAGGGILCGCLLGWKTICAVEIDAYCAGILVQRQNDGILPPFPIWDDVRTFSGNPWRGIVDVVSGGFPCQDISAAGKGAGIDGERSGLWREMARIIGEVRPRFAFVENSSKLTSRGLGRVLGDLAEIGYGCRYAVFPSWMAGAPQVGERIWILFSSDCKGLERIHKTGREKLVQSIEKYISRDQWKATPRVYRKSDGLANRVERTKAIGNGEVPAVARLAWEILSDGLV